MITVGFCCAFGWSVQGGVTDLTQCAKPEAVKVRSQASHGSRVCASCSCHRHVSGELADMLLHRRRRTCGALGRGGLRGCGHRPHQQRGLPAGCAAGPGRGCAQAVLCWPRGGVLPERSWGCGHGCWWAAGAAEVAGLLCHLHGRHLQGQHQGCSVTTTAWRRLQRHAALQKGGCGLLLLMAPKHTRISRSPYQTTPQAKHALGPQICRPSRELYCISGTRCACQTVCRDRSRRAVDVLTDCIETQCVTRRTVKRTLKDFGKPYARRRTSWQPSATAQLPLQCRNQYNTQDLMECIALYAVLISLGSGMQLSPCLNMIALYPNQGT